MSKIAYLLTAAAAVLGLALTALPASAAVVPTVRLARNGTAGYYTPSSGVSALGSTVMGTNAILNMGGVGFGGVGQQLCDPTTGLVGQEGLTTNGSTVSVEWKTGNFGFSLDGTCVGNGVLPFPNNFKSAGSVVLTGLSPTDPVQLYTNYRTLFVHNVWCSPWPNAECREQLIPKGLFTFQAFDVNVGDVFHAFKWVTPWAHLEPGVGIQQDTTGMSACTPVTPKFAAVPLSFSEPAVDDPTPTGYSNLSGPNGSGACVDVAEIWGVNVNGDGIFSDSGIGLADSGVAGLGPAIQVATTGGALRGNAAIVAPNNTLTPTGGSGDSSFDVFAGQVIG